MELDEQFKEWNNNPSTTGAGTTDSTHNNNPDIQDPARFICDEFEYTKLMQETIKYGQELKAEFANDTRREIKKALEDTFALIAYSDARTSSLAPLLEESGRVPVAEELNGAILGRCSALFIWRNLVLGLRNCANLMHDSFSRQEFVSCVGAIVSAD